MSAFAEGLEAMAEDILGVLVSPGSDEAHLARIRRICEENLSSAQIDAIAGLAVAS